MPAAPATSASGDLASRRWTSVRRVSGWHLLAVVAVLVSVAVQVWVAWGARWPAFPYDEVNLLQMARLVAGEEVPDVIRGAGYFPGWAVLMAPIWWFTSDPVTGYRAALVLGIVLSAAMIWPMSRLLSRFGLAGAPAVVVAAVVMTMPARAVQADYALSERLLLLLIVLAVLAAFRLAEEPTFVRAALFAVAVAAMFFTHARVLAVLGAAAVWLLMLAVRHAKVALAGLVMLGAAGYAAYAGGMALNRSLLGRSFTQGDDLGDKLANARPSLYLRVSLGQAWYQSLASYGLIVVGLLVLVGLVWWQVRRWDVGGETFLLGATAATVLISLLQWGSDYNLFLNPWVRLDAWIYGRYIDPFGALLTAIGLAVVVRGLSRGLAAWSIGLTTLLALVAAAVLTREVPTWGFVTPPHVPGLLPWASLLPTEPWPRDTGIVPTFTNENRIWIIAPLCVVGFLAVATMLRRRPMVVTGLALALAVGGSLLADGPSDDFRAREVSYENVAREVKAVASTIGADEVGYADSCWRPPALDAAGNNYLGYGVLPLELRLVSWQDSPQQEIVLACDRWVQGEVLGARMVDLPSAFASRMWVLPGPLQDRLAAEGRLAPEPSQRR